MLWIYHNIRVINIFEIMPLYKYKDKLLNTNYLLKTIIKNCITLFKYLTD